MTNKQLHVTKLGYIKSSYKQLGELICDLSDQGIKLIMPKMEVWVKLEKDEFLPAIIEKIDKLNSKYLIKFINIDSYEDANLFKNGEILLESIIDIDMIDDHNLFKYIGFNVLNELDEKIGFVKDILEIPQNPLLLIQKDKDEIMVPFVDEFIEILDFETQKLLVYRIDEFN